MPAREAHRLQDVRPQHATEPFTICVNGQRKSNAKIAVHALVLGRGQTVDITDISDIVTSNERPFKARRVVAIVYGFADDGQDRCRIFSRGDLRS